MQTSQEMIREARRLRAARVAIAREDPAEFCRFVLKDEASGRPISLVPMQDEWFQITQRYLRSVIWAHVEAGKAVPLDTPIPTPSGFRPMGEIQCGDTIFGSDGKPYPVSAVTETQLGRTVYEVELDDGDVVRADADHQWSAWLYTDLAEKRAPRVVTTREMAQRLTVLCGAKRKDGTRYEQYRWKLPLCGPVQYPHRELPLHPYVLGVWLGNGTLRTGEVTLHGEDTDIYQRCASLLECSELRPDPTGANSARFTLYGIRDVLRNLNVFSNKHIPAEYLLASESQRRELLAGLVDTDGYVNRKKGNSSAVEFCSSDEALSVGTLELIRSLGYKARLRSMAAKLYGKDCGTRHRVFFTARDPVFSSLRKSAQQLLGWLPGRSRHRSVVRITEIPSVPVKCISVGSPDQTYLMGRSYTVTHNSMLLTIGRTLWDLGTHSNLRISILSNTHEQAMKLVRTIARYIEQSDELHEVFPKLMPAEPWTSHQLFIKRATLAKDPSVQACGMHGNIVGSRLDRVRLDDVLDYENCRTPSLRADTWDWYHSTVPGRLVEDAQVSAVGNAYHPEDFLHRLAKHPSWFAKKYPVMNEQGESTWPDRWSLARILQRREEIGPLEFARQMLCQARDDASSRFKREWIEAGLYRGRNLIPVPALIGGVPNGCKTYTGVDLAVSKKDSADLTVFFTIMSHPDGTREVLNVESGRMAGPEIIRKIQEIHRRYHSIIYVEANAAQAFIVQFAQASSAIPVRTFNTGRNKMDPSFGIESLAAELAAGKWVIPNQGGVAAPEIAAWIEEMFNYDPNSHTGDRLMASWIAREGARKGDIRGERFRLDTTKR